MKFYTTILMAVVLFALCLHERKAKESAINESLKKGSKIDRNSYSYLTLENIKSSKLLDAEISEFTTGFSADSTNGPNLTPDKTLLNVSLISPFLSRH